MSRQRVVQQQHEPKPWRSWIRLVSGLIGVVCLIAAGLTWILSLGRVISNNWSPILQIAFVVLGVIFALLMWLFPLSSIDITDHSDTFHLKPFQPPLPVSVSLSKQEEQSFWNIPYLRNPLFTGREDVMKQLHENFVANRMTTLTQAISGLGGIGKTQIAVEYAYRFRQEYHYIFWINAATQDTIVISFTELATALNLLHGEERNQSEILAAVKWWFTTHEHWLVIFDNANNLSLIEEYIPSHDTGHILLTTSNQATGTIANSIDIKTMNNQEGMLFLLKRAKVLAIDESLDQVATEERIQAKRIFELMDGLPLALDQAGSYIEETRCSFADYVNLFQMRRSELLKRRGILKAYHPESVATTWSLAFEKVHSANPAAAELLQLCAFLHPDIIPEDIFLKGASVLGPALKKIAKEPTLLNEAIRLLLAYSLIHRNSDHTLSVHQLIQAVLKERMSPKEQIIRTKQVIRAVAETFPDLSYPYSDYNSLLYYQKYLSQIQVCLALIDERKLVSKEAAKFLTKAGKYFSAINRYEQAEMLYQRALVICKHKILGSIHPETAAILHSLGHLYQEQGKYEQAESFFLRDLKIKKLMLRSKHPRTANTLKCLGRLYVKQRKYEEAEKYFLKTLDIDNQIKPPRTIDSLLDLGHLYHAQDKYEQAEQFYQRALAIYEQASEPEGHETAAILHSLGHLYQEQGKYEQAESFFLRDLKINEHTLGFENRYTLESIDALAQLYAEQDMYEQAEQFYQQALAILEKVLGSENPQIAHIIHRLAHLYEEQDMYEQAESLFLREHTLLEIFPGFETYIFSNLRCLGLLYQKWHRYEQAESSLHNALIISEQTFGLEHLDTAKVLDSLGHLYQEQGKYDQAEPLFQRFLKINEQVLGHEHSDTVTSLYCLGNLYRDQGKYEQAEPFYQRALAIREHVLGPEHVDTADSLHTLAHLYQEQGKYDQAEPLFQRFLKINEQVLGHEHPDIVGSLYCLADLYKAKDKYEQAVPLYRRALAIREQALGLEHSDTSRSIYDLALLYAEMGIFEQAKPLLKQALAVCEKQFGFDHPNTKQVQKSYTNLFGELEP